MNAVEFLSNHRVVVNRQARGAPLPHLTDSAVKMTLAELNKGTAHNTIPWRGRGGGMPTHSGVEFERQLDKISIWLEGWNHTQVGIRISDSYGWCTLQYSGFTTFDCPFVLSVVQLRLHFLGKTFILSITHPVLICRSVSLPNYRC
ncbi:F-box/WD repeat-containing protein 7 [Elysia marginata]|uniref:F-box/WD repeat-containing protein 7 n=1 Tax=Elysia marginata TaxID=1093978 RepID=A0AAV4FSH0_9GAST|nr:F-box/WD repeat-containing protein 7 [Elysia marginata]